MASPSKETKGSAKKKTAKDAWWMNINTVSGLVAVLAFVLYANSLTNGFVLDDSLVITKNSFTTQGMSGLSDIFSHDTFTGYYGEDVSQVKVAGGRYRPLSLAFFAFWYQLAGDHPFIFHFWNVLLYSISCLFLYRVIRHIATPAGGPTHAAVFAGLTALLFTVHPIHTEVVNNIKSNDEILSLLLSLAALHLAFRWRETGKASLAFMSGIALFLGCLAKENAVVFLAIIPLTLHLTRQGVIRKSTSYGILALSLGISFVLYFVLRYSILGWSLGEAPLDLINNPFIKFSGSGWEHCSGGEKMAMIFWSLGKYLQLLFFPYALSTDYYPRFVEVITFANPIALASLILHVALGVLVVLGLYRKQHKWYLYGIAFYLIALSIVSNIVFPVGTNLAERFLFMPSVGFSIAISGLILIPVKDALQKNKNAILGVVLMVAGILAVRTFVRNFDFESNLTLLSQDVKVSANSAKIQNALGAAIAEEALKTTDPSRKNEMSQQALIHLNKAIQIHPTYLEAFYMRGNVEFMQGKYDEAIQDYRKTIQINDQFKDAYGNYALALREGARRILDGGGDVKYAVSYLEESLKLYPNEQETRNLLDQAKARMGVGQ